MPSSKSPIGVFDSGVGGLTVVRALRRALPREDILYLGDTARVPYGAKSPETVERYALGCARFLLDRGVKLLLVACNTASAHALPALSRATSVPVVGAVWPGAQAADAASASGHIGVIGTLGTIRSGAYARALAELDHGARITGQPCPLLVPLAEEGWTHDDVARTIARRYLEELRAQDPEIDTLVLGCTHYPLLADTIRAAAEEVFGRPLRLVDSATAMVEVARTELAAGDLLAGDQAASGPSAGGAVQASPGAGRLEVFVTDASRLDELAERFLGEALAGPPQVVDL